MHLKFVYVHVNVELLSQKVVRLLLSCCIIILLISTVLFSHIDLNIFVLPSVVLYTVFTFFRWITINFIGLDSYVCSMHLNDNVLYYFHYIYFITLKIF